MERRDERSLRYYMLPRDFILPVILIGVVMAMMVPLPPWTMDLLLIANITCAMGLLVSSVCIADSLKLSALPTILLVSTLFRLALNVSSTRLILSHGEAGRVIEAFGKVVIQGNLVVGFVVFLIISLIQFLVVAKGAERVAEVSARFTLDALPGKQMSIDADVRAGLIDFATARRKRVDLQVESRFYGALDGAMKFVKGDAIAGLVIITINVIGGIISGILLRELSFSQAVSTFTVLSVGDGLVAQIPALLNAVAAGLVVTRVSRDEVNSLGNDLVEQMIPTGIVRMVLGIFCILLGFLPSMPLLPCAVLGILLVWSSFLPSHIPATVVDETREEPFSPLPPPPLQIVGSQAVRDELGLRGISKISERFKKRVFEKWGIILAPLEFVDGDEEVEGISLLVKGLQGARIQERGESWSETIFDSLCKLVDPRITEFIDDMSTRRLLDSFENVAPELVAAVVPGTISLTQLTEVLRALARDKLSVRSFDIILQAIAETKGKNLDSRALFEEARCSLKRQISLLHANPQRELPVYTLVPTADLHLARSERERSFIDPAFIESIIDEIKKVELGGDSQSRVLLTSKMSRRLLHDIIVARRISIPVLSFDEISEDVKLQHCGIISPTEVNNEERSCAA